MSATATTSVKRLSVDTKIQTQYAIELWLRDEQIKKNCRTLPKGPATRIGPQTPRRGDDIPIALVGFGPSLNDTWEKLRGFEYIMTCSGAHKFLIDRGIVPTWHLDVDPRAHKIKLLGAPHKDVEYLIASTCHPDLVAYLAGYNVKLWHIFDPELDVAPTLPVGEEYFYGGQSAGLRTFTLARWFGFTNFHIFGMDGCEGTSGKHAAEHPNQPKGHAIVEYGGVEYRTTGSMLTVARSTTKELDALGDVTATFYGEGLTQALARDWKPAPKREIPVPISESRLPVISDGYRALNQQMHDTVLSYGSGGEFYRDKVIELVNAFKTTQVLDYGCGKGLLAKSLPFPIWEYDPAVPEKAALPRPAHIVICTDVLEHVEPAYLHAVLRDLARVTKVVAFLSINTGPARKTLPDGRNTHLLQRSRQWWTRRLDRYLDVRKVVPAGAQLYVLLTPKAHTKLPPEAMKNLAPRPKAKGG